MTSLRAKLIDLDSDTPVKTAFEEGRRGGWNLGHQKPLQIVAESKFEVSDHTSHVRDSLDRVIEQQLYAEKSVCLRKSRVCVLPHCTALDLGIYAECCAWKGSHSSSLSFKLRTDFCHAKDVCVNTHVSMTCK